MSGFHTRRHIFNVDRLGIELPNSARVAELGLEGHARRCLERAKALLETPKA